ncbi:MAG: exopolysaccharide biosynthesis protein [Rhizobiaceae bacterium]|nr:MAG: exopolysaccharide biosynthesis protein [Rhizobiaceae bacterium]
MDELRPKNLPYEPTSAVLDGLIQRAPAGRVTMDWLLAHLRSRSFGILFLVLGVCGLIPLLSPLAGLLLVILAFQMVRGHDGPFLPRRLGSRPIATAKLVSMLSRMVPVLRYLERFVRPRWPMPIEITKRVIGGAVILLSLGLFVPFPLSNVPFGLNIILLSFAYLEQDGVFLSLALVTAICLLAAVLGTLWSTVSATISLI